MKQLNVCYAANNSYIPYVVVSICSLLENNKKSEEIHIFILCSEDISDLNIRRVENMAERYARKISFVMVNEYLNEIKELIAVKQFFLESYARLFIGRVLPMWVKYCYYFDADTIVCNEIENINISDNNTLYAVKDTWHNDYNKVIGFSDTDTYFNAGVIFINLEKWKERKCEERLISHLRKLERPYRLNDQDLLNIVLKQEIGCLKLWYNMLPATRNYNVQRVLDYCGKNENQFYMLSEIKAAQEQPVIIHFAGGFFGKPWEQLTIDRDIKIWKYYYKLSEMDTQGVIKKYYGFRLIKKIIKYCSVKILPRMVVYQIDNHKIKRDIGML